MCEKEGREGHAGKVSEQTIKTQTYATTVDALRGLGRPGHPCQPMHSACDHYERPENTNNRASTFMGFLIDTILYFLCICKGELQCQSVNVTWKNFTGAPPRLTARIKEDME
jgi:hypothetical protein